MKRDTAERFAATAVEGVTLDQARLIIREFLTGLALCSMCGGSGEFTFERAMTFELDDLSAPGRKDERVVPAGTTAPCPRCRGRYDRDAAGDPEFVGWRCVQGSRAIDCHNERARGDEHRAGHAECGYRVFLPLPES
jgi:hypothetical protein